MPSIATNSMRVEVRVLGLADVRAKFLQLDSKTALKIVRQALRGGASVVQQRAVRNLQTNRSVRTGALSQSVIVRTGKANAPNQIGGFEEWAGVTIAPTVFEAALDESLFGKLRVIAKRGKAPRGSIKPRAYAHLIEFGVLPHATGKGSKRAATVVAFRRDKRGRLRQVSVATGKPGKQHGRPHPGFPAKPFMRPAYDAGREQAHLMIAKVAREEMEKIVGKWARSSRRAA